MARNTEEDFDAKKAKVPVVPVAATPAVNPATPAKVNPLAGGSMQGLREASDKVPGAAYIKDIPGQIMDARVAAGGVPHSGNLTGYGAVLGQAVRSAAGIPIAIGADVYDKAKSVVTSAPARHLAGGIGDFASQLATGKPMENKPSIAQSLPPGASSEGRPNTLDPRFQRMQSGQSGVSQAQVQEASGVQPGQTVVKEPKAYSTDQIPMLERTLPDGNRELSIGGNTLRTNLSANDLDIKRNVDALNKRVASMNPADITPEQRAQIQGIREQAGYMRGGVNNTGQAIARPTGADVLAGRQPGQAVRYNRGGLSAEFAPNTSNQEIADFTGTHRGIVNARQEQDKIDAAQAAKLQAMNGGRGPGPAMPTLPDLSGMTVNRQKAAIDAFQAQQAAYDNWHQNVTQAENYQGQNATEKEKNAIYREHYAAQAANDAKKSPDWKTQTNEDLEGKKTQVTFDPATGRVAMPNIPPTIDAGEHWGDATVDEQNYIQAQLGEKNISALNAMTPKEKAAMLKEMTRRLRSE